MVASELAERQDDLARVQARLRDEPQRVLDDFREFFHDRELSIDDVEQYVATWRYALDHPDRFAALVASGQPSYGIGDWFERVRAYLHAPKAVSDDDRRVIDELRRIYDLPPDLDINPNIRRFETCDPAWVPLLNGALAERQGTWPELADYRRHADYPSRFHYPDARDYPADGLRVAFLSDFGTGYYHSRAIARQLAAWKRPYVFHLGDVYYAGKPEEFDERFRDPLADVVPHSKLFGLAENHELYSGGYSYLDYFDGLRRAGHTLQEGSYFCVSLRHHQIIGIDVNWNGRRSFRDGVSRAWLAEILADSKGRTNILLTGSAPYEYGSADSRGLLADLWEFVKDGQIHLWLWGDDHYNALFARHPTRAPFVGSCIGHGGFPGPTQAKDQPSWVPTLWVETEPRFPAWTNLHQDAGNNGWCDATLGGDGSVELLYVDWLAAKRHRVVLSRDGEVLLPTIVASFDGREHKATVPRLHRP
jgi:hypothetical protein